MPERQKYEQVARDDEEAVEETIVATRPDDTGADESPLSVVILDYTQKKFNVTVPRTATVQDLKQAGAIVHKVPADRQRLVFRGKLLEDPNTLSDSGIAQNDLIIHLFPKPRVVIKDNEDDDVENDQDDSDSTEEGARVPTIFLNSQEARSSILVLGSADYMEAQNNVKLFSFMLLIISSVELLNLTAIALGVPQESGSFADQDDIFPNDDYNSTIPSTDGMNITYQEWGLDSWVDLVINLTGFYVALLGLRATTHNTLVLAQRYLRGVFVVGTAWLIFNYAITFEINEAVEQTRENNNVDDYYVRQSTKDIAYQTLSMMVLPCMVWCMCCLRAWQFQFLLREAEEEAQERMQEQMRLDQPPQAPNHDEELALQDENATIS